MACIGIQNVSFGAERKAFIRGGVSKEMISGLRRNMTLSGDRRRRCRNPRMCLDNLGLSPTEVNGGSRQKKPLASPHLEQLMNESVTEIVKNINGAPFVAQIYTEDTEGEVNRTSPLRLVIDKATSETWPYITKSWEDSKYTPEGVILVQELRSEKDEGSSNPEGGCCTRIEKRIASSDRVWGLVVQGRGVSYPACYVLKTCQVQCCFGLSTHYCLAKVDCFGKDVNYHLNKLWLQR